MGELPIVLLFTLKTGCFKDPQTLNFMGGFLRWTFISILLYDKKIEILYYTLENQTEIMG